MGSDSDSPSHDGRDEDGEEEEEEEDDSGRGNRLLGFMFGNVDGAGDLDVDYLDEDAKEHLAALADKLGPSLTDIDLSVKSPYAPSDAADQDYDKKAEDAIDYEDIDEQYEGPEVQAATEEDFLLSKKDYFSKEVSLTTLNTASVFDDENYDEEDDDTLEKQPIMVESNADVLPFSPSGGQSYSHEKLPPGENLQEDILSRDTTELEILDDDMEDLEQDDLNSLEEPAVGDRSTPLPVLCIEDGMEILRFSEIFAIHAPRKKAEKRDRRYIIPKDKYKSINASDIVEEDEEKFLKASSEDFSWTRRFHIKSDRVPLSDEELAKHVAAQETRKITSEVDEDMTTCTSAESMQHDLLLNASSKWTSPFSPKFYPLDQQGWEDRIIWSNSPVLCDNAAEICELSGPDSEVLPDKERDSETVEPTSQPEIRSEFNEKDQGRFLSTCSVLLESFDSDKHSPLLNRPETLRSHPQLLRLESEQDAENTDAEAAKNGSIEAKLHNDAIRRFSNLGLQNRDVLEDSWLDSIIWEENQSVPKPKLILDLQDKQMLFELLDNKDANHLRLHAGAMIITRSVNPSTGDSLELHGHGTLSAGRFNISNDKFYSNRKSSQQLRSHSKKRTAHGLKVLHSVPALKLQTMKAKLSNKDIAHFHRPKALWYPHDIEVALNEGGKLPTQGPMKIILKTLGSKGSKLHVDADETISSVKAKASKKLDFKLSEPVKVFYSGKELEDHKSLSEQNVQPNSILHLIRTKIYPLPRAQKLPGEHKSLRPPGAFKKKADLSVKDGHVFLMEYCEERPLLLGNAGMGARLCTYYQKSTPGDQTGTLLRNGSSGLGNVVTLDPADKSPFLGDIKPGCSQSCLETNMYRAPIFQHKVSSTDYLLVRSAKGKLSIRRIDRIYAVGQQEPHMEVMAPGSKGVQLYIMNRLLVYMYREFRATDKPGNQPSIRADELSAQFPSMSEAFLRKRLKHCADLQRRPNGQFVWVMRSNFRIPSEEELRRMVTPENVCAYESMQAGLYRLKRLGITRLTLPTGLSSAMNQLPDEAIALAAASHIERELQIAPWNLSSNFVSCTSQDRENIERLEITGVGDPSGRGLGFSYVRSTPKAPVSNSMVRKKTVIGKGTTVTGTDADLRRLSMEAARELLLKFNVPEEQIAKLTRWHRIALIRKLSSEQAASGVKVDPTTVSKFARGQRMSFLQLQQQTREKCQEIWDRQVQSLCAADGEENESESEANSDLDSFAGDLENLLDAEEGEEGEEGNDKSKHDAADGVKGLKMRRRPVQTQAEEEIEDEAAEAAELCRMLMDDEEAERKKKKKAKEAVEQVPSAQKSKFALGNADRVKKANSMVKKISQPEETYSFTENVLKNQKENENFSAKKNLSGKLKGKKKTEIEQSLLLNKKVKIVADNMKMIKEKKSARETFVCGACGQLGHMKTNKNCPKYGEDPEKRAESTDPEKMMGKPSTDQAEQSQQKSKKIIQKGATKIAVVEASEDDKPSSKAKVLKVKCSGTDRFPDTSNPFMSQSFDRPVPSDAETGGQPVKVSKITFSNKLRPEEVQVDLPKPSIVIKPPAEADRDLARKKIVIKKPKEIVNLDDSPEGSLSLSLEHRKTKKIMELSSFDNYIDHENKYFSEETSRMRSGGDKQWWEEEGKKRTAERRREETNRRSYEERMRMMEEQPRSDLRRYEESLRSEREEEERQKARAKKNKKKRKPELRDDYLEDLPLRRNDRRIPERDRMVSRRTGLESRRSTSEYAAPTKRLRGGEVILANILENIVETLRGRTEISLLFLKPVTKKEAPDYLDIIEHPMDLSTIRDRARNMYYRSREEFRHDVYLIVFNAHLYNDGRNPGIPPLADQLLELCDYLLRENEADLEEAEHRIEHVGN